MSIIYSMMKGDELVDFDAFMVEAREELLCKITYDYNINDNCFVVKNKHGLMHRFPMYDANSLLIHPSTISKVVAFSGKRRWNI